MFEDPSIDASDIEIHGAYADELEITGTGFNMTPAPVLAFDPPLDPAAVGIDVSRSRSGVKNALIGSCFYS